MSAMVVGGEPRLTQLPACLPPQIKEWHKANDRERLGTGPAYMTDPEFLCHTWDWVQQTGEKPSSGLVGVVMAMKLCEQVRITVGPAELPAVPPTLGRGWRGRGG